MTDIIVNFFHLAATAVWIGGALFMHIVLQPSLALIDPQQAGKLFGIVAKRFSITAWICIIILLITGLLKTPQAMLLDVSSDTGVVLLVKHIFVLGVIVVGLVIALGVVPRLRAAAPAPGEKPSGEFLARQRQVKMLSMINGILSMLILICASMLW